MGDMGGGGGGGLFFIPFFFNFLFFLLYVSVASRISCFLGFVSFMATMKQMGE